MLNSHKCSDSSIFCINAKICTTNYLYEVLQASHIQMITTEELLRWSFFNTPAPDFIRDSAERERCPHVKLKKSSEYKDTRSGNLWRNLW